MILFIYTVTSVIFRAIHVWPFKHSVRERKREVETERQTDIHTDSES